VEIVLLELKRSSKKSKNNKDIAQGFNKVYEYEKKNKWRVTNKEMKNLV
jgi:hypothetical protein